MINPKQYVDYIGQDDFVRYSNTDDFHNLSLDLKKLLKNFGVFCNPQSFPFLKSDGKLKMYKEHYVQIASDQFGTPFCIDLLNNEQLVCFESDGEITIINSSVDRYNACMYTYIYYYREIENKKKYGAYYENDNYKKYARILRDMFNKIEPGIEHFQMWEDELFQKELGVI